MNRSSFEDRKRDHIRHALDPGSQAEGASGLDRICLVHDALPELDLDQVLISESCLGEPLQTPFYVAGMTAGHPQAPEINLRLAAACAERGWVFGVGSQRRELDSSEGGEVDGWSGLRKEHPALFLIGNIGASQLVSTPLPSILRTAENLGADAIAVHLNALQEAMQPEGTPQFAGVVVRLRELSAISPVPVIVKETGCGFSERAASKLEGAGIAAVDVSGLGGTHWGRIEGARAGESGARMLEQASRTFAHWGESTVDSVLAVRRTLPGVEAWASGGIRSGLDAAKMIALGARRVGFARPALEAALEGERPLREWMERMEFELKVALFCTGCQSLPELRENAQVWTTKAP